MTVDTRIIHLLTALRLHMDAMNDELTRLHRSEQFTGSPECMQLCEQLRESYFRGLENLREIETGLRRRR